MTIRIREYYTVQGTGSGVFRSTTYPVSHPINYGRNYISDVVAVGDGGDLTIIKQNRTGGHRFTGSDKYNNSYSDYHLGAARGPSTPAHLTGFGSPTLSELASDLLAKTNPSRPVVDIPVFIGELGDLPDLVRKAGGSLLRRIAAGNLKYQFGIRPLVSDLTSMLNFADISAKRFKELKALQSSGLRRKKNLFSDSKTDSGALSLNSGAFQPSISGAYTRVTSMNRWGFVKWFPTGDFPAGDPALQKLARRAVLGLTVDGSTAWELIPFSWLADYFSNVGSLLKANRNIVAASHSTPLIMTRTKTTRTVVPGVQSWDTAFGTYVETLETKERSQAIATLGAHLPVLSLRQMSILGSLVILRSGRYH